MESPRTPGAGITGAEAIRPGGEIAVLIPQAGPHKAEGTLVDHPATPTVHTRRDGHGLDIDIMLGQRRIGGGRLVLNLTEGAPLWPGEVALDGCWWWVTSVLGSGVLTSSCPRGPGRGRAP